MKTIWHQYGLALLMGIAGMLSGVSLLAEGWSDRLLDGVKVEAVENPLKLNRTELNLSAGMYPFHSYYDAFLVGGDLTFRFSSWLSWRMIRGQYAYVVNSPLAVRLADDFKQQIDKVDKLQLILQSDLLFFILQGKYLLLSQWIRYFQVAIVVGGGMISFSETQNTVSVHAGLRARFYASERLSWFAEVIDYVTFLADQKQTVTFILGTGINF